ncbi:DNA-binding domain-containing protein [Caldisalinibacter kiritimatiensis]|uniref:Two-component response regulator, controling glutamine utilization n=1 Tax=Caldisalinibacter kiritimatiensis TaxID=1304284 RepID=R1CYG6_9FIRM|nr:DNA-binding domain-containing protein [Caldisalinibacter kiritimatiensis]EOD01619.1 Two-component response regulator, controling glutamine utilization [Caldisalinibacter kiritimatiensis]
MTKFYIVEDDTSVVKILENIIEDENLGEVIGYSCNGKDAVKEIYLKKPDVVLVDLLMPELDGIDLVKEIKRKCSSIRFIMISQVSSKEMIGKAYKAGIEFFITKPINIIEVVNVIEKVIDKKKIEETLYNIKDMFESLELRKENIVKKEVDRYKKIKEILSKLGILGEKGSEDILDICYYLIDNKQTRFNYKISEISSILSDNPKAMEQRIRRAINKALTNIANLGIEDYMNDSFIKFSNTLFNFEDVKAEMDYIRKKRTTGGKVNVKKFIEGLLFKSEI